MSPVCLLQTVGGDNDYVKVPTPRRPRPVTEILPPTVPLVTIEPTSSTPPADISPPPPEMPAPEPDPAVPIVYETLRQDATGGNLTENLYLVPAALQEEQAAEQQDAQPVDLTQLLANQQMNAAAISSGTQVVDESMPSASSQPLGIVKNVCRQPCDVYYVDTSLNENRLPLSSQQFSLYTNMDGLNLSESEQIVSATGASVFTSASPESDGTDAGTAATTSGILRRPSQPTSSPVNTAGASASGSAVTKSKSFTYRLPSYEESMSSDAAGISMSPVASPLSPTNGATVDASPSTPVLPGYESPPSYISDQLLELNANTPLKSRQVQQLQDEMSNDAGVRVQLDKTQCAQALALIDCYNRVW